MDWKIMTTIFTKELVAQAMPPNLKNSVTQELIDNLNSVSTDQIMAEEIRNNFLSYSSVLREGRFKIGDYLNAVSFVSFRIAGDSNHDAYFKTFPTRYQNLLVLGKEPREIASYVAQYAKGQLVNKIMEQTIIPSWVLNQDMYQKALNVQYEIMTDEEVSPKVRAEAANSLLTHLSKPKEAAAVINLDMRENSGLNELKDTLSKLAMQQQQLINQGITTKEIAAQTIIDVKAKNV